MSFFQSTFSAKSAAVKVRFGQGIRRETGDELAALGKSRALILSTPNQHSLAQEIADYAAGKVAGIFTQAEMHTPVDVTQRAVAYAREMGADIIVSAGGGSTIGLGKAIALHTNLDQIAIPTTYAGSEATPILGQTDHGRKTTLSAPSIQPEVILYDPELLVRLPSAISVCSAFNAMAHAAEGLYAQNRSPLTSLMALEGLRAFKEGLPRLITANDDLEARGETLYGAWLCGTVLGQVGMALHHKLCHTLGGSFNLPHADIHTVILPHALAYNASAAQEQLRPITALFGKDIGAGLHTFAKSLSAPIALRELGLREEDIGLVVDLACQNPYWNPRPVTQEGLQGLLTRAWAGEPPQ